MTNKHFEVERITNGASGEKRTTKTFKDEEKAIAYAKRYHRTTKTIKSVKTTVYYFNGTDTGITYRANTKNGTEKDYREQATEVKKVAYYGVRGYSRTFDTIDEAVTFAKNQRSKSELIIYKAIEIDNGIRTSFKQVDVVPAYSAKQHTHYELEIEDKPEPEPTPKIKTLQDWEKKGGNFTDFCKVGDKVDKGIVDYFVDVLPPITWRTDLVQCGEPYGHRDNPETGRWEAMYITFAKNDSGQWCYAGNCFLNQRKAIA